ncbi:unnamed protein product [Rotaria magnacalcarata]
MHNFEIRVLLRHYWKKGLSARAAAAEICEVEGEGTIGKTAAIKWFKRFENGDLDFEDKPRSGRQSILNEEDSRATLRWVPRDQNPPSVARQDHFAKKVMLCVWWNVDGVVHFELVPDGRAVDAELYSEQLERVYNILMQCYPTLIRQERAPLQHDNAPAHRANLTKEKLGELDGIEVLSHPAYSPDLGPSDYGLFRSIVHFFRGRRFEIFDQVEAACREFFEPKESHW